jgi:hypothetical protein
MTEADKARIEREAMSAYYERDAEALRRLIRELLSKLGEQPRKATS